MERRDSAHRAVLMIVPDFCHRRGLVRAVCIVKNVSILHGKAQRVWLGARRHNRLVRAELEQFPGQNISGGTGRRLNFGQNNEIERERAGACLLFRQGLIKISFSQRAQRDNEHVRRVLALRSPPDDATKGQVIRQENKPPLRRRRTGERREE